MLTKRTRDRNCKIFTCVIDFEKTCDRATIRSLRKYGKIKWGVEYVLCDRRCKIKYLVSIIFEILFLNKFTTMLIKLRHKIKVDLQWADNKKSNLLMVRDWH